MKRIVITALGVFGLAGCTTVDVHYASVPKFDDSVTAADNAKNGLAFYTLQKIHISVAPQIQSGNQTPPPPSETQQPQHTQAQRGQNGNSGGSVGDQAKNHVSRGGGSKSTHEASGPDIEGDSQTGGSDQNSAPAPSMPKPVVITVGGKPWTITLTALADTTHGFMMGGNEGFWNETSVAGTRTPNSDKIDTVSIKAQNLTAKRIGQIASVVGDVVKGAAEADATSDALQPFDFDVDVAGANDPHTVNGTNWKYTLKMDTTPAGAVSYSTFLSAVNGKTVNFFPVPACVNATLTLQNGSDTATAVKSETFSVSTPEVVRLEPLPIDGKLQLSSVCGSSANGTQNANSWDDVLADVAAIQSAYQTIHGGSGTGESGPTGGSAPH